MEYNIGSRACTVYSDHDPEYLLIQPADAHELEFLEKEIGHIKSLTAASFAFVSGIRC